MSPEPDRRASLSSSDTSPTGTPTSSRWRTLSSRVLPVPDQPVDDSSEEEVIPKRFSPKPGDGMARVASGSKRNRPLLNGSFLRENDGRSGSLRHASSYYGEAAEQRGLPRTTSVKRKLKRASVSPLDPSRLQSPARSPASRMGTPKRSWDAHTLQAFRFGDRASGNEKTPRAHTTPSSSSHPRTFPVSSARRYSLMRARSDQSFASSSGWSPHRGPRSDSPAAAAPPSSSRFFLLVVFAVFFLTWLLHLNSLGESARAILSRTNQMAHSFHLDREPKNEQVLTALRQTDGTARPAADEDDDLLVRLRAQQQAGARRAHLDRADPQRHATPPPMEQSQREEDGAVVADRPSPEALAAAYRPRVAMELTAFYTLKGLGEKIARVDSLIASVGVHPRSLYTALVKHYGAVDGSFPVLLDWVRESEMTNGPPAAASRGGDAHGRGRGRGAGGGDGRGRARGSEGRHSPAKPQFHAEQQVTAAHDIEKGGSVVVGSGSPGIVTEVLGDSKLRIRFLGKFGDTTPVVLAVSTLDVVPVQE